MCWRVLFGLVVAMLLAATSMPVEAKRPQFKNPPVVQSQDGLLTATLIAAPGTIQVGGVRALTNVYNGAYIPPVLVVSRGDVIRLRLLNLLGEMTNLHYHGYNGSPLPPGDNVFLEIQPANEFDFELEIPADQGTGLHWYHPHMHGLVEPQIFGGMSGAFVVRGLLDPFPELQGITDRVLLLKDIQIRKNGRVPQQNIDIGAPSIRTVNGQVNPTIEIAPGETQLWRIGNIGADRYYRLRLEGHTFYQIALDGNRTNQVVPADEIVLPPGSRSEALIQARGPGTYRFRTLPVDTGPQGDQYAGATLATMVCSGPPQPPQPLPTHFPPIQDLRDLPLTRSRTVVFSESANGNEFFINGEQFNPNVVNTRAKIGDLEEWTIRNTARELHTFHIHQVEFQVTEINGVPQPFTGYLDNVNIPFKQNGVPGEIKVRIPFFNPAITGKFVYHCHITQHEDAGMMAVIEVEP